MAHAALLNPYLFAVPVAVAPHQLPGAVAIHEATRNQDFESLALLLAEDPSLIHAEDVVGRSPLMMSSLRGHVDVSAWLLDHGAPLDAVDVNKRTAMYNAASYGFVEVVKLLMERGADPSIGDCEGNVPIIAGRCLEGRGVERGSVVSEKEERVEDEPWLF
jgi:ankyrin repeat protein|eukprot:evm.model.NODE_23506_length_13890_cov_56.167385.1